MVELWTLVASWATPTALFVLLNIVIGVIAISSLFSSSNYDHPPPPHLTPDRHHHQESPGRLVRAPSLFSRVTSFNLSQTNYNFNHFYGSAGDEAAPYASSFNNYNVAQPENPPLERAPSLLSRMTSLNGFSFYRSVEPENPPASGAKLQAPQSQPPIARAPSLLSRMTSLNGFSLYRSLEPENPLATIHNHPSQSQPPLERSPSLLSRMASFNFSLYRSAEPEPAASASEYLPAEAREQHMTRAATEPKKKKKAAAQENKMKKSSSDMTGKEDKTASFRRACDEEVDAKADDFINRFKHQLRLQRLESLLRYRNSAAAAE